MRDFDYYGEVKNRRQQSKKLLRQLKSELAKIEAEDDAKLFIHNRRCGVYFEASTKNGQEGISSNENRVCKLARKRYLEIIISYGEWNSQQEERYLQNAEKRKKTEQVQRLFAAINNAGFDVRRVTFSADQYKWAVTDFRGNPYNPEELKWVTPGGIKMRSKSEREIGTILEQLGIPYRYEAPLRVDVSWMTDNRGVPNVAGMAPDGKKTYYPDFTILCSDGNLLILEHFGLLDFPDYRWKMGEKIAAMRGSGLLDDAHFIMTTEKDMVNHENITKIVLERILPLVRGVS